MAKVWNEPGSVTAIVRDLSRTGHFFVALGTSSNAGAGRIFEIHSDAPLHFTGQDITANLPMALVMTLACNRFEPDVLYAGTKGRGVFRGMRNAAGHWTWQDFNNGMPEGAIVTKLRVNWPRTIYGPPMAGAPLRWTRCRSSEAFISGILGAGSTGRHTSVKSSAGVSNCKVSRGRSLS
jgi:hypothetical protein